MVIHIPFIYEINIIIIHYSYILIRHLIITKLCYYMPNKCEHMKKYIYIIFFYTNNKIYFL